MFEFESKKEKKSNDDSLEMIGYGAIFIVVIACVIVSLPILLVSLFLAVLFSKLFEKRTTYLVSFIGLLASVAGLYFWSYPPLLQSLVVWKGMMPDWIKKSRRHHAKRTTVSHDLSKLFVDYFC